MAVGEWQPLATKLVVEVQYDYWNGERFRTARGNATSQARPSAMRPSSRRRACGP